jgi:hypothetical protein
MLVGPRSGAAHDSDADDDEPSPATLRHHELVHAGGRRPLSRRSRRPCSCGCCGSEGSQGGRGPGNVALRRGAAWQGKGPASACQLRAAAGAASPVAPGQQRAPVTLPSAWEAGAWSSRLDALVIRITIIQRTSLEQETNNRRNLKVALPLAGTHMLLPSHWMIFTTDIGPCQIV